VDALAMIGDERRDSLRKASGSWQISFDPEVSEWALVEARSDSDVQIDRQIWV